MMDLKFEFATANRIIFGPGTLMEVGNVSKQFGMRALVVIGIENSDAKRLLNFLKKHKVQGFPYIVQNEPTVETIQEARLLAAGNDCEMVIGFGGGSAIDTAKAVSTLLANPGDIYNFLAAVSALVALEFEIKDIIEIFQKEFQLPNGRGKLYESGNHFVIDESYTATPRALAKTTRSLVSFKSFVDKLVLIIGDMEESGPNIEEQHLNMGYFISALPIDHVITVGHYADYIGKGVSLIQNTGKSIVNCNSVDDILKALDDLDLGKSAITVQGIGQVGLRRINKHLEN